MPRVFIGVGHGGSDPGAVDKVGEAAANLFVALKMQEELERHGVAVAMSRIVDENDPVTDEIREANTFAPDIACGVHSNAGGGNGWEAYVQTNTHAAKSRALAQAVESEVKMLGQESRGIKTRLNPSGTDYYGFLRQITCPAVILEGFFVDSDDALGFDTAAEQQALGVAYAKGILAYFGIAYQRESDSLTQEQFDRFMDNYLTRKGQEAPAEWSEIERRWAEENGIIQGDTAGNKQYQSFATREHMIVFLYRLAEKMGLVE